MCWITLSPKDPHRRKGSHHTASSAHGSSVEEVVRIHHGIHGPRFNRVRIAAPSITITDEEHQHHRHHHRHPYLQHHHPHLHPHMPHIHPLHMHPLHFHPHHHHHHHHHKLAGPGRRRHSPGPPPPPPSRSPSTCPPPKEPIYRTQIVEPRQMREVRETTRIALREARPDRGRLRRVAGYEVLGREVPWSWDCISSVAGEETRGRRDGRNEKKGGDRGGSKFPPFGPMDQWM